MRGCVGGWVGGCVGAWVRGCVGAWVGGWVGGCVSLLLTHLQHAALFFPHGACLSENWEVELGILSCSLRLATRMYKSLRLATQLFTRLFPLRLLARLLARFISAGSSGSLTAPFFSRKYFLSAFLYSTIWLSVRIMSGLKTVTK